MSADTTDIAVGYEAGSIHPITTTLRRRTDGDCKAMQQNLHALCIEAMHNRRGLVPHVERRIHTDIVAMAPLPEVLAECMDTHVVHHALMDLLRNCKSLQAQSLRDALANRYAMKFAPRIVELGGAQ